MKVAAVSLFSSCLYLMNLFQSLLYDNDIVDRFYLSKTKCSCFVLYGLGPFYITKLIAEVKISPYFTLRCGGSIS